MKWDDGERRLISFKWGENSKQSNKKINLYGTADMLQSAGKRGHSALRWSGKAFWRRSWT